MNRSVILGSLGRVNELPRSRRVVKTWKHCLAPTERWEQIVGARVVEMRGAAERSLGSHWCDISAEELDGASRVLVEHLHDDALAAAYLAEAGHPESLVGPGRLDPSRWLVATPRGAFLVAVATPPAHFITIYRPQPPLKDVLLDEADFARHARVRWEAQVVRAAMTTSDASPLHDLVLLQNDPLESPLSCWRYITAIARSRRLALDDAGTELIAEASARVAARCSSIVQVLAPHLDLEGTIADLTRAVDAEEEDQAIDALLRVEELVECCELLRRPATVRSLVEAARDAVRPAASHLPTVLAFAVGRGAGAKGAARELWSALSVLVAMEEARSEVMARSTHPGTIARSVLDRVSPRPTSVIELLAARVASLTSDAVRVLWDLRPVLDPALGEDEQELHLDVVAPLVSAPRVFVVDADNPQGEELDVERHDDHWRCEGWRMRPGEEALVVVVRGAPDRGDLDALLGHPQRMGFGWATARVTRPRR